MIFDYHGRSNRSPSHKNIYNYKASLRLMRPILSFARFATAFRDVKYQITKAKNDTRLTTIAATAVLERGLSEELLDISASGSEHEYITEEYKIGISLDRWRL